MLFFIPKKKDSELLAAACYSNCLKKFNEKGIKNVLNVLAHINNIEGDQVEQNTEELTHYNLRIWFENSLIITINNYTMFYNCQL